ncbi:MAG: hypothetical protein F4213_19215 [Boseongicola sp. SB0677_bin_26]|nr:hypothetical protein [Boseongicola sp. SB0677_bin_26]
MTVAVPERSRARRTRRRLHVGAALALILATPLGTLPSTVLAQADAGGTLGIDCEKPRRNADGKLVLDDDGIGRAQCEADRATALNYAGVVRETRDRLRAALAVLPPPVWDDLVNHLRNDDGIDGWSYADPDVMSRLRTLSDGAPPGDPSEVATTARAHGLAEHWDGGILAGSGVGADWRGTVRARACGFGPGGAILPGAMILVWLDPGVLRDRWTPAMVQRTARAWLESQSDRFVAVDVVPDVVTATRQLARADGSVRDVSGDPAIQACFATVPEGALAMRITLWRHTDAGRRAVGCADPDQVGLRRFVWARQNGVFIVPENAILAGGDPHPERGEPLLGQGPDLPLVATEPDPANPDPQDGEFLAAFTCRLPRTVDAVRVEDCDAEINGRAVKGVHVLRVRFREVQNDPVDPLRIDLVPVGPDPLDPANELGVIPPPGPHPVWETTTLFCAGEVPPRFVNEIPIIPAWDECREPADCDGWVYPDCTAQWGGRFDQGQRIGFRQIESYPPGWPVDEVEVRRIDDDCFNPVLQADSQSRTGSACEAVATTTATTTGSTDYTITDIRDCQVPDPDWIAPAPCGLSWDPLSGDPDPNHPDCGDMAPLVTATCSTTTSHTHTETGTDEGACECPAGWSGSITQERDFEWHNRDWAVPVRHRGRAQWSVGQVAGFYDDSATTDALNRPIGWLPILSTDPPGPPGMPAFIRLISLTADWHEETNTCSPPVPRPGSESEDPVHYVDANGNTYVTNSYQSGPSSWSRNWSNGMTEVLGSAPDGSEFSSGSPDNHPSSCNRCS